MDFQPQPEIRVHRMKKFSFIYWCAVPILTLILSEVALRFIPSSFQRPYRISYRNRLGIGQELIPNIHEKNWHTCFGTTNYSTNQWGMRDRPRSLAKTIPRIAVLSDSFMEAEQVNDDTVLNHQLERLYDNQVEVLNFAMGGIGTTHEAILYDTWVRQFRPDMVLLMFSLANDISNNSYALEKIVYKGHPFLVYREINGDLANTEVINQKKQLRQWLLRYSALARFLKQMNVSWHYRSSATLVASPTASTTETVGERYYSLRQEQYLLPLDAEWEDAWRVTELEITRLNRQVRQDGAELVVVIMPDQSELEDDTGFLAEGDMPTRALGRQIDLSAPRIRLINYLKKEQIPVYDLASDMKEYALAQALPKPFYSFSCDLHWTPLGHQVATNFVFDYLENSSSTAAGFLRSASPLR